MSLSSLQKKMNSAKMLAFVFLVGLLSLTFLVLKANAAPIAPSGGTTTVTTTYHILFSFTTTTGDSSATFGFSSSTDNSTWSATTTVATTTGLSFNFPALATNTLYYFRVAAGDATVSTTFATAQAFTLATTPGTPTLTSTAAQTMKVVVNSSTNPANTRYIVRDTAGTTTLYLQDGGTWGSVTSSFTIGQLGGNTNGTTTIGLATNTLHTISVAAVNGDLVTTTYGNIASIYTLAATPVAPTITSANPQQLTIVINAGSNSTASTTFIVRDTSSSTLTTYLQMNHTWGTVTSSFTYAQLGGASGTTTIGLATSTPHIISVAAVNGDLVTSSYSSVVNVSTIPNTPTSSLSAAALTTMTVTINSSTNPTSTLYIVRDTGGATATYLQTDHTWGTTTTTIDFGSAFVNGLVSTSTTGLTANTPHIIAVAAVSGDHTQTSSYGATTSLYTLANTPSSVVLTAAANGFTISWSGDSGEEFWAEDSTVGTNSGWITGTSYSVGGINCGTTRTFTVAGRNGDQVVTASSSALSATTNACGGTGSISAPAATPAKPAVPGVSPAVPATPASVSLPSTASPVAVFVHTLKVGAKGNEVKQLQQKLRELGYFKHPTNTGLFGPATRAAVKAFQKAQGLSQVGFVGPGTRAALNSL